MGLWWISRDFSPMFLYCSSLITVFGSSGYVTIWIYYINNHYLKFYLRRLPVVFCSHSSFTPPSSFLLFLFWKFTSPLISLQLQLLYFSVHLLLHQDSMLDKDIYFALLSFSFPFIVCTSSNMPSFTHYQAC